MTRLLFHKLPPEQCRSAAAELQGDVTLWSPLTAPEESLARTLVHAPLAKVGEVLTEYDFTRSDISRILDLLSVFSLDPKAPARLPEISRREPGQRAAALNSERMDTGNMYIWRGFGNFPPGCKKFPLLNQFNEDPAARPECNC